MSTRYATAVLLLVGLLVGISVLPAAGAPAPSASTRQVATAVIAASVQDMPLLAHASSQLPHATLRAEGRRVQVTWTAAPDDAADVGVAVGLLPPAVVDAYLGGDLDDLPDAATLDALAASPALHHYLLTNIRIYQDGQACPGTVLRTEGFIERGATLVFDCPLPVTEAIVHVTMLHDRDPAYRTFSVDGTIQTAVHTVDAPAHLWDFTRTAGDARAWLRPALLVGLVLAGLTTLAGLRLLPRRAVSRRVSG